MSKRAKRRSFTPRLTALDQRCLLSLTANWMGQDGNDFVGTASIYPQAPNDYQDIHFRLTGMTGAAVTRVYVERFEGGAWTWVPGGNSNAFFRPDSGDATAGDLFLEPYFSDDAGRWYQKIRVEYAGGGFEETSATAETAVDPNRRVAGKELGAIFRGQDGQDWTGPYISVGPDGIQDFHISVSNLSNGADVGSLVLTASPSGQLPTRWQIGNNPEGYLNAELINRPLLGGGTTGDLFASPTIDLLGVPLTLTVTYSNSNRSGKTDTVSLTGGSTNVSLAVPTVGESNLPTVSASSTAQDAGSPGNSHVALDGASLQGLRQSFDTVRSAILSNRHGSSWLYMRSGAPVPYTGGSSPLSMQYNATTGVFDFPPVRDEAGSTLTLLLTFDDGSQAVARFSGAQSDINRRVADTRIGATPQNVFDADGLITKLQAGAPYIHLKAGSYVLNQSLDLSYPVRITADPGITLTFALSSASGSPWNSSAGAIRISSSHVSLDGFAIRFQGNSGVWAYSDDDPDTWDDSYRRAIIQAAGSGAKADLSFTNLDIQGPAFDDAKFSDSQYEPAIKLMNFDSGDAGLVSNNILKGGTISLGAGPWKVLDNDFRGTVANTITSSFLSVRTSHDLTIRGNHLHSVAPAGITQRFLVFGGGDSERGIDSGQGIDNLIENNTIETNIGMPPGPVDAPGTDLNAPEMILTETYQPRFEGTPSAISPDGYVVRVPHLRGLPVWIGDVVSILTGPYAGQWRMVAQALDDTRYLLDSPLPAGSYVIAIGRGFVDQTYRSNTIDLRGTNPGNIGMVFGGNHWRTQILNNTFYGAGGVLVDAGPTEGAFKGGQPAPWGWTHLATFDVTIDGNTFQDARLGLQVNHSRAIKSNSGRVYFTGAFSNNQIRWTSSAQPTATIGVDANPYSGEAAYIRQNVPWLDLGELRLTTRNNWGQGPSGEAPTLKVLAATIDGIAKDNQVITLPTSPPNASPATATSRGQDGRDYIGSGAGSTGPEGFQDIHIALAGLPSSNSHAR